MGALWVRHLLVPAALALVTTSVVACGADPLAPLPVQAASAETVVVPSASPSPTHSASARTATSRPIVEPPAAVKPTKTRTPKPRPTSASASACFGAVQHDLDLQNTVLDLQTTMCFRTGGVLRLKNIGPGLVDSGPADVVSGFYEAGIVTLRFIRPGTATITIPQEDQVHTITVVVRS